MFDECIAKIERGYSNLSLADGWRFLYSPKRTLSPDSKLWFVGLNPSLRLGDEDFISHSVERGNAYRVEHWTTVTQQDKLQGQAQALFQRLAPLITPQVAWRDLMDRTLTLNFCPFRSRSWDELPNRRQAIAFSLDLWSILVDRLDPSVVMCLSTPAFDSLRRVFLQSGFVVGQESRPETGWGSCRHSVAKVARGGQSVLLVGLPHLSRFTLLSRAECLAPLDNLLSLAAVRLTRPT